MKPTLNRTDNVWDRIKSEMESEIPHIRTLPFLARVSLFFTKETGEFSKTVELLAGYGTQSAVTKWYKGKEYISRWGKL